MCCSVAVNHNAGVRGEAWVANAAASRVPGEEAEGGGIRREEGEEAMSERLSEADLRRMETTLIDDVDSNIMEMMVAEIRASWAERDRLRKFATIVAGTQYRGFELLQRYTEMAKIALQEKP